MGSTQDVDFEFGGADARLLDRRVTGNLLYEQRSVEERAALMSAHIHRSSRPLKALFLVICLVYGLVVGFSAPRFTKKALSYAEGDKEAKYIKDINTAAVPFVWAWVITCACTLVVLACQSYLSSHSAVVSHSVRSRRAWWWRAKHSSNAVALAHAVCFVWGVFSVCWVVRERGPLLNSVVGIVVLEGVGFVASGFIRYLSCLNAVMFTIQLVVESMLVELNTAQAARPRRRRRGPVTPESVLQLIPVREFDGEEDSIEEEDAMCAICLEDYLAGEEMRVLPCRHHFHVACIGSWLTQSAACPLCKQDVRELTAMLASGEAGRPLSSHTSRQPRGGGGGSGAVPAGRLPSNGGGGGSSTSSDDAV